MEWEPTDVASGLAGGGGAISITGSNNTWIDCTFLNNTRTSMPYGGGAICIEGSENKLFNCSFENNKAGGQGGAIYIKGSENKLFDCTFVNNHANIFRVNSQIKEPFFAEFFPMRKPFKISPGFAEKFEFHLFKFTCSESEVSWCDFIAE